MGREEQAEEREVLDAIYPDEITDISEDTFRVSIALDIPLEDGEEAPPPLLLTISLPPTYPSTAPHLSLSLSPSTPPHPLLLPSSFPSLLSSLSPTITDNLETQMLFTLISTLKDLAEAHITSLKNQQIEEVEAEKRKEEELENKKFMGEAVTRESFLRWREEFRIEVAEKEDERRKEEEERKKGRSGGGVGNREERVTGRMMWERGLVGREGEGEDEGEGEGEGEGGVEGGIEGLKVED